MNETDPPVHPAGQDEVDDLPEAVSVDSVKQASATRGALLFCINLVLAVIWFALLARPAEHVSGHAPPVPLATVTATSPATDPAATPPDATPTVNSVAATPTRVASQPTATPVASPPSPTPTPTPTPTTPPSPPTFLPGA